MNTLFKLIYIFFLCLLVSILIFICSIYSINPLFSFVIFSIYLFILIMAVVFISNIALKLDRFPFLSAYTYLTSSSLLFLATQLTVFSLIILKSLDCHYELTRHYLLSSNIVTFLFILSTLVFIYLLSHQSHINKLCHLYLKCCLILCLFIPIFVFYPSDHLMHDELHLLKLFQICLFYISLACTLFYATFWYKKYKTTPSPHTKTLFILFGCYFGIVIVCNLLPYYHSTTYIFLDFLIITILLHIFSYIVFKYTLIHQVIYFKDKLNLHEQNNLLLNKYIESITKSQASIVKQYSQVTAMYTQLMDVYPDALFIMINSLIIHANGHAYKLLDLPYTTQLIEKNFLDFLTPESKSQVEVLLKTSLMPKTISELLELKMTNASGQLLDVEAFFTLSKERGDNVFMVSIRDISDKKHQAEMQKQIEMEHLKIEFFSTLSHELKTPVNIIYSAVQLQNDLITSQELDKTYKYNTMISQNCMRLLKLLNNLLDINRIGSNHFKFSPTTINMVTITEDILTSITPYANKKQISILFDTDCEEIYSHIDPDLFERILLNLFSNAIKYTPILGHLWVNLSTTSTTVYITIKDDGVGIPSDKLKIIFERFARVDSGLIRQAEGAGIGLSIVKSLVELNKGTICVKSHLGNGSEFTIALPLEPILSTSTFHYAYTSVKDKIDIEFSDVFI